MADDALGDELGDAPGDTGIVRRADWVGKSPRDERVDRRDDGQIESSSESSDGSANDRLYDCASDALNRDPFDCGAGRGVDPGSEGWGRSVLFSGR